ncbi:MAG: hypothetical protein ACRD04_13800 [Terriglobales bacterium]
MRVTSLLVTCVVGLALLGSAAAQNEIQLQGGAGQAVTFTGMGAGTSGLDVTLGGCGWSNACVLYGTAAGSGTLSSEGIYMLLSAPNALQLSVNDEGGYAVQTTAPIEFPYFGVSGSGSLGLLLTGKLNLNQLVLQGNGQGELSSGAGLTVSGGALAGAAVADVPLDLTLGFQLPPGANLGALAGTSGSLTAGFTGGTLGQLAPTPEPPGGLLAATGALLLGLGLAWRRRSRGSSVHAA